MGFVKIYSHTNDSGIGEKMATFKYTGETERVFPSLGITVQPGEDFNAPTDFSSTDVILVKTVKATAVTKEITE